MNRATYKPSAVLRLIRAGKIDALQPRGTGRVLCEGKRHALGGETESPAYWENGTYVWCPQCKALTLARPQFATFEIDLTGERKRYPLVAPWEARS